MQREDLDRVSQIENECFSTPWSRAAFEKMIENDAAIYLVAECDGKVVGNCGIITVLNEGDICNVAVDSNYRKLGIASKLVSKIMELATVKKNVTEFTLEVRAGNRPAIKLYENLGFLAEGIRPRFYTDPVEDAIIYWKR